MLTSCATIPNASDATDAVSMLRQYEGWAWALGIVLLWADLALPVPQTSVIAALGIIAAGFTLYYVIRAGQTGATNVWGA